MRTSKHFWFFFPILFGRILPKLMKRENSWILIIFVLIFIIHFLFYLAKFVSICARTQIFLTSRKDTIQATGINQIPTVLVKAKPAAVKLKLPVKVPIKVPVKVPVNVPVKVPVIQRQPITVTQPKTPYEVNKLFNEMKNSKKPFMTIQMKAPAKQSMFPDPFSLFDDDNRYCWFVRFEAVFHHFTPWSPSATFSSNSSNFLTNKLVHTKISVENSQRAPCIEYMYAQSLSKWIFR